MAAKNGIRLTIGTKISFLVALLLVGAVAMLVVICTQLFIAESTDLIQQANADSAASLSLQMREVFERMTEKMMFMGSVLLQDFSRSEAKSAMIREFFQRDENLLAVLLYEEAPGGKHVLKFHALAPILSGQREEDVEALSAAVKESADISLDEVAKGDPQVARIPLPDGSPAVAVGIPFVRSEKDPKRFTHLLVGLTRQARFLRSSVDNDLTTTFMIDRRGTCLSHSDAATAEAGENLSSLGIVQEMLKGKFNNGQTRYVDPQTGQGKLAAFRVVGFGGLGVVAEVPEAKASEAAWWIFSRAVFIAIIVACAAVLVGNLFSDTISSPIYDLVRAAARISKGDFRIDLKPRTRDEIGYLSRAFNDMAKGLEERDRVKERMSKFHNPEVAEKLLSGEVSLGGERKLATILFCDIRNFTKMSEPLPPAKVVDMLNEYMSRMVPLITEHGGIVDKYMGDAIMAVWGVPIRRADDAERAIEACLAMRDELGRLNAERKKRGEPELFIGMGLNSGLVIEGNIGSSDRMEFTVIGDAVNLASRVESTTKAYGTDLLITKSVFDAAGDKYVCEQVESVKVKGKTGPVEVFKVRGFYDAKGRAVMVETPYSEYPPEASDKVDGIAA